MFENTKNVKRIVSFSVAALCMFSAVKFVPFSSVETDAADSMTAFEITEDMKIGWNYGNSLDATGGSGLDTETSWGNPKATQEMMDAVKAKGFNTVRLPTTWYTHLDENNNIDPEWMTRVHEVVDYAYKNDMYVILNLHHEEWINRADIGTAYDEMAPRLKAIWKQIAEEFKDYDQHLVFEGMNEPRAVGTDHEWWGPQQNEVDTINKLNQDFVDTVRSVESPYKDTRLLMCPPYCASSDASMMSTLKVPDDPYVAASIHAYSPYGFTMDKTVEDHSTFSEAYATELETILNGIRKQFVEKDIPVVLGEFSASNFNNTEARCEWAEKYISLMKAYGIPCMLWDNDARGNSDQSEAHDYLNRKTLEWYEDSGLVVDKMMEVLADDSIKWGSQKYGVQYDHEDITKGNIIFNEKTTIDASTDNNCTPQQNIEWSYIGDGDVAVKFTGDEPILAFMNDSWGNWTEVKPYDVKDGIAYFSSEHIKNSWKGDIEECKHILVKTNGVTTVEMISIIGGSTVVVPPIDTTKKYNLDLTGSNSTQFIALNFEGKAGSVINGCIGYMGEEWTTIEWDDVIGNDGKLCITIPRGDIPDSVTSAEAQIWWCDDPDAEMVKYEFLGTGGPNPDYGDSNCDGKIDMSDAVLIMQSLSNPDKYGLEGSDPTHITEEGIVNADCYNVGDGVTNQDALAVQMLKLELIDSLPISEPAA